MSRSQTVFIRQLIAGVIVGAACLVVAMKYAMLIEPAAAREVKAACNGLRPSATNPNFGSLPSTAPVDFTAQDHTGKMVKLSDYRGKVVFVNFWASWCNVCKSEKPGLVDMTRDLANDDFVVLTLASDSEWQKVKSALPDGAAFDVLLDPPQSEDDNLGAIARRFGLTAVPESFVIDRRGHIRYYFINKRDWHSDVAETCLQALVDET